MKIRLAGPIESDSIVDGEGIRTVIWTQGCVHNCYGCHNPETHAFDGGTVTDTSEIIHILDQLKGQDGITLSGGDPMCQVDACLEIAKYAKTIGLNVWCYTGYTFEQLLKMSETKPNLLELLKQIDMLVDGKFILEQKSLEVKFRGSKNQRIVDVKKSLEEHRVVTNPKYDQVESIVSRYQRPEYMFV